MHSLWHGIYPALTTPFSASDSVDFQMFEKNMEAQIAAGAHGWVAALVDAFPRETVAIFRHAKAG